MRQIGQAGKAELAPLPRESRFGPRPARVVATIEAGHSAKADVHVALCSRPSSFLVPEDDKTVTLHIK